MKKVNMTLFHKECDKINNRLHDYPGKTESMRLYRKLYQPGVATRMYRRKKIYFCTECGCEVQWRGQKQCPQCGVRWANKQVATISRPTHEERDAVIFQAVGGIQLTRYYRVERRVRFGAPVTINVWEIMRFFYAQNGQRIMYQRAVNGLSHYWDSFSRWGRLYYRKEASPASMGYGAFMRANLTVSYWGVRSLTKQWSYKNVKQLLDDYNGDTSAIRLIAYPYAETMLKCGQSELFGNFVRNGERLPRRAENSVNLCIRHKYTIDNPTLWLDTIKLLTYLGYDTHNPKYVCPDNLGELHDKLVKRKLRVEEAKRAERARRYAEQMARMNAEAAKRAAEMAQHWTEHFGKMLSIDIKGKDIEIRPLQSIEEFKEEGAHMHHCVYACEYYNYYSHPSSLILTARDGNNKRLATIEYDMRINEVVQCRAACNEVPPRKAEIEQLISENKWQFEKYEKTVQEVKQSA